MTERYLAKHVFALTGCQQVVYKRKLNCPDCIYGAWIYPPCKTCNNIQYIEQIVEIIERPE